jgi:signal peptidase complex subunit 3
LRLKGNISKNICMQMQLISKANHYVKIRGLLKLKNQKPKYQITHPSGKIAETADVTLKLHYNVQPWVGILTWDMDKPLGVWNAISGGVSDLFTLPALKSKDTKGKDTKDKSSTKIKKSKKP